MKELGEGAVRAHLLLGEVRKDATVLGDVRLPLGMDGEIVVHSLVTDVEVLITPVGSSQGGFGLDRGDMLLAATELSWLIHGVDFVQDGALSDRSKIISEVSVAVANCVGEIVFTTWCETEGEGEDGCLSLASLRVGGHLGETDGLDPVSLSGESGRERLQGDGLGVRDVVHEIVFEPVKTVLSVNTEHANEVGGVVTVSEQLDTHAWGHVGSLGVDGLGDGESGVASVGALEHAGVWVSSDGNPLDLTNVTLSVDGLVTAAVPSACQLVTWGVEDGCLVDDEGTGQMEIAGVLSLIHISEPTRPY